MNTSVATDLQDQAAAPSTFNYYPLLGLALILGTAAATYGPLAMYLAGK